MFNQIYGYIKCSFCHGKLQALKQVQDPNDPTGQTIITESDDDQLKVINENHLKICTASTPYTNDPNADYSS